MFNKSDYNDTVVSQTVALCLNHAGPDLFRQKQKISGMFTPASLLQNKTKRFSSSLLFQAWTEVNMIYHYNYL